MARQQGRRGVHGRSCSLRSSSPCCGILRALRGSSGQILVETDGACAYADTDANADTERSYTDDDAHLGADDHADADGDTHTDDDALSDADGHADGDSDTDADGHARTAGHAIPAGTLTRAPSADCRQRYGIRSSREVVVPGNLG